MTLPKNWKLYAAIAGIAVLVLALALTVRACRKPKPPAIVPTNIPGVTVTQETYHPPVITLPFVTHKPPVPTASLPIPASQVAASATITVPGADQPIVIVTDHEGGLHPVDAPVGTTIAIANWKPPLFQIGHHFTIGAVACGKPAFILSYDPIRIWRFRLGLDAGVYSGFKTAFAGASLKLHVLSVGGVKIHAIGGYEVIKRSAYVGGGISL
jgi:hypothetical protein